MKKQESGVRSQESGVRIKKYRAVLKNDESRTNNKETFMNKIYVINMSRWLVVLFWVAGSPLFAAAYKCKDENGNISYSQMPCPENQSAAELKAASTRGANNDVCAQTQQFTDKVVVKMRAGNDSGSVISEYGGLEGISKPALSIINYIYTYKLSPNMTPERIGALVLSKCNNQAFGEVTYADIPGAEDPNSPEVIERKKFEEYMKKYNQGTNQGQVAPIQDVNKTEESLKRSKDLEAMQKANQQSRCQEYKRRLREIDDKTRQGYGAAEGDTYREERRKYRELIRESCG
jgi:hypothetical protein